MNPTNYEAYFLLYVDNELSREERDEVEAFLQQHPETQPLLEELLRTRQVADPEMVFPDKSKLFFGAGVISDEALLSYLDKETVPAAVAEALQHPSPELAKRLQAFEQTIAEPDPGIVFPDKARLYRRSKPVSLKIWRGAAAAILIGMAVGTALWMQNQNKKAPLAKGDPSPVRNSLPGNDTAGIPADDSAVAADTMPQPGKETAIAVYKTSNRPEQERQAGKKEQRKAAAIASVTAPARSTTGSSTPVLPDAGVAPRQDAAIAINKATPTLPAVQDPGPEHEAVAITREEKQPKAKKSLFKKLTQSIEERISGTLTDGEGQVTIAGFAVNVK